MDVDKIFNTAEKTSKQVQLLDKIRIKQEQMNDLSSKTCGNCNFWMKYQCVPEHKHGHFKTINSVGCELFNQKEWTKNKIKEYSGELKELIKQVEINL